VRCDTVVFSVETSFDIANNDLRPLYRTLFGRNRSNPSGLRYHFGSRHHRRKTPVRQVASPMWIAAVSDLTRYSAGTLRRQWSVAPCPML